MKKKIISIMCIIALLSMVSCAVQPDRIKAQYMNASYFTRLSCSDILFEKDKAYRELSVLVSKQTKEANKDAIGFWVGMFLFWPAIFLMIGSDHKEDIAELKGRIEALDSVIIQKGCYKNI